MVLFTPLHGSFLRKALLAHSRELMSIYRSIDMKNPPVAEDDNGDLIPINVLDLAANIADQLEMVELGLKNPLAIISSVETTNSAWLESIHTLLFKRYEHLIPDSLALAQIFKTIHLTQDRLCRKPI